MAGDGSDGGGGENETVARGNTKEEAKAGWIKSDIYIDIYLDLVRFSQIYSDTVRCNQLKLDVVLQS